MGHPPPAPARLVLRVSPGASRTEVAGRRGTAWRIRIAAAPERGRANEALTRFLAAVLGVSRRHVRVVAGAAARDKVIEVTGLNQSEAERLLADYGRTGKS